jgi:hypothetical protein
VDDDDDDDENDGGEDDNNIFLFSLCILVHVLLALIAMLFYLL